MTTQLHRFYPDSRHPVYQIGSPIFTCLVSRPGLTWHWQLSAPLWKHSPETTLIDHGTSATPQEAEQTLVRALHLLEVACL